MDSDRPRVDLARVLADLGSTLLEVVRGDLSTRIEIDGVAIYDAHDELVLPSGAIVLGVGLHDVHSIASALVELGADGAQALVVRSPVVRDEQLVRAVDESGVALLALTRGASWTQLAAVLRTLLVEDNVGRDGSSTDVLSADLFTLANAVAALVDAPVTIEDRSSHVLAFSGRQDEADADRIQTILGRQVPEQNTRALTELGVFEALYKSNVPVYVESVPTRSGEISLPRAAIAVRAGDEVLGSIWAAVREPLSAARSEAFEEAAKLVALHLLRLRAGADVDRRLRADLVSTAIEGGRGAAQALTRLGLAGRHAAVLALGFRCAGPDDGQVHDAGAVAERHRVADAFALHLSGSQAGSAATLVGDVVYGILPVRDTWSDAEARVIRVAEAFLMRIGDRHAAAIGIGEVITDLSGLAASRSSADRALRVLLSHGRVGDVATASGVQIDALLLDLADLVAVRGEKPSGPIARLIAYDAEHQGHLVETLRAWLDTFGDVIAAAVQLYVHPNTFRYRVRRVVEVGQIDLNNSQERFAAMVQLRLMVVDGPRGPHVNL
ncbi:hypothetical protein ABIB25_000194 [Nakamurella sp. UYEF19]|uniref:helix-turn-helix domain-containing protein n=1 Tax=Nakamurella sp. UYEF19 TaxID=1756392 RepID=UPI003392E415